MVCWTGHITFIAFNAECNTTGTIIISSSYRNRIVPYWNGIWAPCAYSSALHGWTKWADNIEYTVNTCMDNQRDGRLCFIGSTTQTNSSIRTIIKWWSAPCCLQFYCLCFPLNFSFPLMRYCVNWVCFERRGRQNALFIEMIVLHTSHLCFNREKPNATDLKEKLYRMPKIKYI